MDFLAGVEGVFFFGAGEGGTDFLASLTRESDELRELAAAGEM